MSETWEVRDRLMPDGSFEYSVQRAKAGKTETGAKCWDYGLACVIEAALNLRDGSVE